MRLGLPGEDSWQAPGKAREPCSRQQEGWAQPLNPMLEGSERLEKPMPTLSGSFQWLLDKPSGIWRLPLGGCSLVIWGGYGSWVALWARRVKAIMVVYRHSAGGWGKLVVNGGKQ